MTDNARGRSIPDSLWAWIALGVAFALALVVAPWDTSTSNVAGESRVDEALGAPTIAPTNPTGTTGPVPTDAFGNPLPPGATPSAFPGGTFPTTNPTGPTSTRTGILGQGVTKDTIKVGYIWLKGQEEAANDFGFAVTGAGDVGAQIAKFTTWINANGGIAGKRLISIVRPIDFRSSSTQTEQDLCTTFAQEDHVFAVVLVGQIREVTRKCYTDQKILTFDPSGFPMSSELYDQTAPYLWSPSYPTINETSAVLPAALKAQGYWKPGLSPDDKCVIEPCTTGVLLFDFPNYHTVLRQTMLPALNKVGISVLDANILTVDASDAATVQSGLASAVVKYQAQGVTRLLFIGGSPLAPFFMVNAKQQKYTPVYGITSFDQPRFATEPANGKLVGTQIWGAMGIGTTPVLDVFDKHWTNHATMWDQCVNLYKSLGFTWPDSVGARVPVGYCESTLMLRHVASKIAPDLTAEIWARAADGLGSSFQTATGMSATFRSTKRAGGASYRYLKHHADCECIRYSGGLRKL